MRPSPADRVAGFVEDLLRGRRPRRFLASEEEVEAMTVAARLVAGRVGADLPDKQALDRIHQKLARGLDDSPILEARFSRRAWLRTFGAAAAAVVAGVAIDEVVRRPAAPVQPTTGSPVLTPVAGQWRPVAALSDLPDGHAKAVSAGAVDAVVVNNGGEIHAVSGVCTHLGCRLQPDDSVRKLDCPCHQTAFAWSGKVLYYRLKNAPSDLPHIQSRLRDGQIELFVV
jgi:cytochrome b6-f complex iron-sulfur subunit